MSGKHTPGPWEIYRRDDGFAYLRAPADKYEWRDFAQVVVAMVGLSGPDPSPEGEANAQLIAAAPELLEAEKALNFITNIEGELGITLDSGDALRAAIASAKGGAA